MTDVGDVKSEAGYSHFVVYNMSTHFTMKYDSYYGDAGMRCLVNLYRFTPQATT